MINYDNAVNALKFVVNSSTALRIESDGRGLSQFTAKAWVSFDVTGTLAVDDSHNVSSVTDVATGNYRVNLSNNMTNALYTGTAACGGNASGNAFTFHGTVHSRAVGSYGINTSAFNGGTVLSDGDTVYSIIFGD